MHLFALGDPDIEAISLALCEGLRDIAAAGMKLLMTLLTKMTSLCQLQRSHHTCQRNGNMNCLLFVLKQIMLINFSAFF